MTGIFHPTRGGNRGGKDQFQWEDVKSDKDRENYLGHSLKAPVGRWQKGKDLIWYTKERGDDEEAKRQKELAAIRDLEAQAMASALGHGAPALKASQELSKETLHEAFKRNAAEDTLGNTDRVHGMGYKKTLSHSQKGAEYGVAFKRPDELETKANSADSMQRKRSLKSGEGDDEPKSRKKKKKEKKRKSKKKKSKRKKQLKDPNSDNVSSSESSNDYRSVEEDTPKRKDSKKVQSRSKEKDNEIEGQERRRDRKQKGSDDERVNDGSRHRGSERQRTHHRRDYMKRRHSGDEREIERDGKRKKYKGKSEHPGYSYDRHGRIHSRNKNIRRGSSRNSLGALSSEEGFPRSKRGRDRHDSD